MLLAEICRSIDQAMAEAEISRQTARAVPDGRFSPFRISPEPFPVTPEEALQLQKFGNWLRDFYHAADQLYRLSRGGQAPDFIAQLLDAGKPEWLLQVAESESFDGQIPIVIRPDLLLTDQGFQATELDSVPGSMGLLSFLEQAYRSLGHQLIGELRTSVAFRQALQPSRQDGLTLIVVSEECDSYRPETSWLAEQWRQADSNSPLVVSPEELQYDHRGVWWHGQRVGKVYRFFELFDLDNVAGSNNLLHMAAIGKVKMTAPPKAHLEEKIWFAWLHHAELADYWHKLLGEATFQGLLDLFPKSWVVSPDQRASQGGPLGTWRKLQRSGRSSRPYVLKPSGFSSLAWGGHGFSRGKDYTTSAWDQKIDELLRQAQTMPYILQQYMHSAPRKVRYLDFAADQVQQFDGKTRLCPYYFLLPAGKPGEAERVILSGALATTVPLSKPVIHGMTEAVMAPTAVKA